MSYPAARYLGEQGEVNATFRPSDTPANIVSPKSRTHYLATHALTRGEFGLYRIDMDPRAPGPSTHFHRSISESFFVLSGTISLYNGERWIKAKEGDFLYVPTGGLHGFKNDDADPASMLLLFSPGAPREEYFEKIAEMTKRGGQELADFLLKHDSYFVTEGGGYNES